MSESTATAASDPNAAAGTAVASGGEPLGDANAAAAVQGSGAAGANPSGDDFEAKVRANPDFAVNQVKEWQRRADQAAQQGKTLTEWLGPLRQYMDAGNVSGSDIASHLDQYLRVVSDPSKKQAFDRLLNGGPVQTDSNTTDDELYLTDEEKEIRSLKQELAALKGQVTQQSSSQGQQALIGHLGSVSAEMGLNDEQKQTALKAIQQQVQSWAAQGDMGQRAIASLSTPDGKRQVQTLVIQTLGWDAAMANAKAQLLQNKDVRQALGTDSPSGNLPSTAEPIPEIKSTLDALKFAEANPDVLEQHGY